MCGQFVMIPRELLEKILNEIRIKNAVIELPDWPARPAHAFPKSIVPLVVSNNGQLQIEEKMWGYPVSWSKGPVFNTRVDTALQGNNMWTESLEQRRCVVPTLGFCEPHKTEKAISTKTGREIKQKYSFGTSGSDLTFLGGIYEDNHFSVMTTDPNPCVSPVHNRMPLVLTAEEINTWMFGEYETLFDRSTISLNCEKGDGSIWPNWSAGGQIC